MPQSKQFDLNLFRVFVCVCETRSFTKAAAELMLTQSSISNAMARLKRSLGEELFVPLGRGIEPTAYALELHQQLQPALAVMELAYSSAMSFNPETSVRQFNVFAPESVVHMLQQGLAKRMSQLAVDIVFRESPGDEQVLLQGLQSAQVDVAIDIAEIKQASFTNEVVGEYALSCVVATGHPRIHAHISRRQYFAEKHVLINLRRFNVRVADMITEEVLPTRKVYSEQASIMSMFVTIANSEAIGIAPTGYAKQYAQLLGLQVLPLPLKVKPLDLFMIWPQRFQNHAAHRWLRETLGNALAR